MNKSNELGDINIQKYGQKKYDMNDNISSTFFRNEAISKNVNYNQHSNNDNAYWALKVKKENIECVEKHFQLWKYIVYKIKLYRYYIHVK